MTARSKAIEKRAPKGPTLGRGAAFKLNAVEGISLPQEAHRAFAEFDRLDLPAEERRRRL